MISTNESKVSRWIWTNKSGSLWTRLIILDQVDSGQGGGEHGLQVQRQTARQAGGDAGADQVRK